VREVSLRSGDGDRRLSKVYSTAILAGEKSGNLPGVLDYYIAYQRVSTGVRKKILATLVYPVLLLSVPPSSSPISLPR